MRGPYPTTEELDAWYHGSRCSQDKVISHAQLGYWLWKAVKEIRRLRCLILELGYDPMTSSGVNRPKQTIDNGASVT